MSSTFTIPLTQLTPGSDLTSPGQLIGAFTRYQFSIDRNVGSFSLDGLTGNAIEMWIDYSMDNANWNQFSSDGQTIAGGVYLNKQGQPIEKTVWGTTFPSAIYARCRIVPLQIVSVSGSLTLLP